MTIDEMAAVFRNSNPEDKFEYSYLGGGWKRADSEVFASFRVKSEPREGYVHKWQLLSEIPKDTPQPSNWFKVREVLP